MESTKKLIGPVLVFLFLLAACFLMAPGAAYADNPQFPCSATPEPGKYKCAALIVSPWEYRILPAGVVSTPTLGPFSSEQAAISAATAYSATTPSAADWCSYDFDHIIRDIDGSFSSLGVDLLHRDRVIYTGLGFHSEQPPCQTHIEPLARLERSRGVSCPHLEGEPQWQLVHDGTAATLPYYCACPWDSTCQAPCCDENKGNPIEMLEGAKVETEVDYEGAGVFPLRFVRTYRGDVAYSNNGALRNDFAPLGVGWRATYFQRLYIFSSGGQSSVVAYRPTGRWRLFRLAGSVYVSEGNDPERVVPIVAGGSTTGWQYITASEEIETYDAQGRLLSIANRAGITHTLTYASTDDVTPASVSDPWGHQLTFTYDAYVPGTFIPKLTAIILPGGTQISFTYDTLQNLTSVAYPNTTTRTYLYQSSDPSGRNFLTGVIDENGVQYATFAYQGARATSTEYFGGVNKYTIEYSGGNRQVTDPLGMERTYTSTAVWGTRRYNTSSALCPACGESKAMTYDANGNVASRTDFNDIQTVYSYESARPLEVSRTEALGTSQARTIATSWHASYRLPTLVTEPTRTTAFSHDASGNVLTRTVTDTSVTPNVSRTWTYTYNSYGQVLTENGPRTDVSDITTYTYYTCTTGVECGQVHTATNALSQVTTFHTYNAHGQPLTFTDSNSVLTTLSYDSRQRLTSISRAGETTSYEYWPTGLLKKVTQPDSSYLLYTYDNAHRLIQMQDALGNRISYALDAMGNRTAEEAYDPANMLRQSHARQFNALNQLWKEIGAAGTAAVTTTFGYDTDGNQTTVNAPLARNTVTQYDALDRLKQVTDPGGGVTQFGYDAADNLISVTDPKNLLTSYVVNGFGEVTSQSSPDTGTTTSTYDAAGNVATHIDARGAAVSLATYTYDALNRATQIAYPDQTITFTYDTPCLNGVGRVCSMTDQSGTTSYEYDALGRVTKKTQALSTPLGTHTRIVRYQYANGHLTRLTMPSGVLVDYGYDSAGRIGGITVTPVGGSPVNVVSNVQYDPFGQVKGWTWANGSTVSRQHDGDGRMSQLASAGSADYSYDDAGRITAITATSGNPGPTRTFGYDLLDRMTSESRTGFAAGYTYDANGNRLSQTGTLNATYTYPLTGGGALTSNRLQSVSGGTWRNYTYDAAGHITTDAIGPALPYALTYDGAGRLSTYQVSSQRRYNALGARTFASYVNPYTYNTWFYNEEGRPLEICPPLPPIQCNQYALQEMIWLGDTPVAAVLPRIEYDSEGFMTYFAREVYNIHSDQLNAPRRMTHSADATNTVVWRWDPESFGIGYENGDADNNGQHVWLDLRFPGQVFDSTYGRHYNYFRDYDPYTGRYLESDPAGQGGGPNTYGYANASPIMSVDPYGLLALNVSETTTYTNALDLTTALGGTMASLGRISCECHGCGGKWSLIECSTSLQIEVYLRNHYSSPQQAAWVRRGEMDHVLDFRGAVRAIRQAGQAAESRERSLSFSSKADCELSARVSVILAMDKALQAAIDDTRRFWDKSKLHDWNNQQRRP